MAYCMLGIFDINMPLLYGEGGPKAFIRLQEEIVKVSSDHTIFCWSWPKSMLNLEWLSCFAPNPVAFKDSGDYIPIVASRKDGLPEYSVTNVGLRIDLPLIRNSEKQCFGVLNAVRLDFLDPDLKFRACLTLLPPNKYNPGGDYQFRRANGPPFPVHLDSRWSSEPQRVYLSRLGGPLRPKRPDPPLHVDMPSPIAILPVVIEDGNPDITWYSTSHGLLFMRRVGRTDIWLEDLHLQAHTRLPMLGVSIIVRPPRADRKSEWYWVFPAVNSIRDPDFVEQISQLEGGNLKASCGNRLLLSGNERSDGTPSFDTKLPFPVNFSFSQDRMAVRGLVVDGQRLDIPAYIVCIKVDSALQISDSESGILADATS